MSIIVIGIDLAKNIFAVHGVNENGHAELVKPKVSRDQLLPLIANFPPCLIGMEAYAGSTPLGVPISSVRPHHQTDGAKVRHPLPHERQTRQERPRYWPVSATGMISRMADRSPPGSG